MRATALGLCVHSFDLWALSAKWHMSIWKLVNFHSTLDFVESLFFAMLTKIDQRGSLCMQR